MRISVIIPTYNHGSYVADAIQSALHQTYTVSEVIVVDDGSTDDTRDIVRGYGDRIRYIHQANSGLSAARNTGIRAAHGDWLAFLDADDFWVPNKVAMQVEGLARHRDVVFVYCSVWLLAPDGLRTLAKVADKERLWPTLRYRNCIRGGGSAVLVRREVVLEVGGFDESLRACEDWDLWMRIALKYRHRFATVSDPLVVIRVSPESMSADYVRMTANTENIMERTLLLGLTGMSRMFWRHRIRSADLYRAALSARDHGDPVALMLLYKSLLKWPSPFFLWVRWRVLLFELVKVFRICIMRLGRADG